jgi:hypothetical protein
MNIDCAAFGLYPLSKSRNNLVLNFFVTSDQHIIGRRIVKKIFGNVFDFFLYHDTEFLRSSIVTFICMEIL